MIKNHLVSYISQNDSRLVLFIIYINVLFCLFEPESKASSFGARQSAPQIFQNGALYLLKGIANGRYKKPGWNEYLITNQQQLYFLSLGALPPHPRLITSIQLEKARSNLNFQPYQQWYLFVQQQANQPSILPHTRVIDLAEQTKACAFMYRLEENAIYLQKALMLLEQLPEPPQMIGIQGGKYDLGWGDYLQSSMAIPDLCLTYDLLVDEMPIKLRDEFERKLLSVIEQLAYGLSVSPRNNHVTVMSIAIATCALTIDAPERILIYDNETLFKLGMKHLSQSLGLIAPDGGYAEGPYYARFILNYLAQFSIYLLNVLDVSLFQYNCLQRMVNWAIDNEKGSGQYTQFDDAFTNRYFYLPLLVNQSSMGIYWDEFFHADKPFTKFKSNMVEALAVYQTPIQQLIDSPFFVGHFYPDMGQVIFRDRQLNSQFFASIIFEQERWFANMHEQIDPLSFELSAYGEDFISDGGYGNGTKDKDRDYFISPQANSAILVDGYGTNPNPLTGDELLGHLDFAFSTTIFAAASISHRIGDAQLTRQIFYPGKNHLILLDRMESSAEHSYTIQLKCLGEFIDESNGHLSFHKNRARLDIYCLTDDLQDWQFEHSRGLATSDNVIYEHNVLKIQSAKKSDAILATLWMGSEIKSQSNVETLPLVNGHGEWRQFHDISTHTTEDFVWNDSDTVSTSNWHSDARLTWVKYHFGLEPEAFLLIQGSYFQQGNITIRASQPMILYLERQGNSWAGYVQFDDRCGKIAIQLHGINALPFKFNNQLQNIVLKNNSMELNLSQSGTLSFGMGEILIDTPQPHYPEPDILKWISQQSGIRQKSEYWSDYEKTVIQNQITKHLINGASEATKYWSQSLTGDSSTFHQTADALFGLLSYTYHPTVDNGGFRLPHIYGWEDTLGNSHWEIREEGNWRHDGLEIRDLWVRSHTNENLNVDYRLQHPYHNFWGHYIDIDLDRKFLLGSNLIKTSDIEQQNFWCHIRQPTWHLRPAVMLKNSELSNLRIDGNYDYFLASVRADRLAENPIYFQTLKGKYKNTVRWILEGQQIPTESKQFYRTTLSGIFQSSHFYLIGLGALHHDRWQSTNSYFTMSGQIKKIAYVQHIQYNEKDWYWSTGLSKSLNRGFWSADLNLKNWQLGKTGYASLNISRYLTEQILWNHRLRYAYCFVKSHYQLENDQQFYFPIVRTLAFTFLWNSLWGNEIQTKTIGGGFNILQPWRFYVLLIQNRFLHPTAYQANYGITLSLPGENYLNIYGTILWRESQPLYIEICVQQPDDRKISPGLYYRYLRPKEHRLEGYLEWRW